MGEHKRMSVRCLITLVVLASGALACDAGLVTSFREDVMGDIAEDKAGSQASNQAETDNTVPNLADMTASGGGSSNSAPSGVGYTADGLNMCAAAVKHLVNDCGYYSPYPSETYRCADEYDTCEARCYAATPCSGLGPNASEADRGALNTCLTACYAEGPATCAQAEEAVACTCGYSVRAEWNTDGFCDAEERCISNCAMASDQCWELLDAGTATAPSRYLACTSRCREGSTRTGLTFDAHYCAMYPADAHCPSGILPAMPRGFCLEHPTAPACADVQAYCAAHPEDGWCESESYACAVASGPAACGELYCSNDNPESPSCSDPRHITCPLTAPNLCAGACSDVGSSGSMLYCLICLCQQNPAYCQGGSSTSEYCDENPSAPECDDDCVYYPHSLECDDANQDIYEDEYN